MTDPLKQLKALLSTAQEKADFIDGQLSKLEILLDKMGPLLHKEIVDGYLNQLDLDRDEIQTSLQNQRKTALLATAYRNFQNQQGYKVVTMMIEDMYSLSGLNNDYFSQLQGSKISAKEINAIVNARLGINSKGEVLREGFMKGLFDDEEVKNKILAYAAEKTIGGTGYEDLRTGLKELIQGNGEKMGAFKQFYRNAAYDTYAKIDALSGKLYADKLGLRYFIYAGTRRKASRHFCILRKGKVYSSAEAELWKELIGTTTTNDDGKRVPAGPIVAGEDVATYNWAVDRGGYGCVDDIMWISEEIAFARRPDLRPDPKEAPKAAPKDEDLSETTEENSTETPKNSEKGDKVSSSAEKDTHQSQISPEDRAKYLEPISTETHRNIKEFDSGGVSAVHRNADKKEVKSNTESAELIAKFEGAIVEVAAHVNKDGVKNPELIINGQKADNKTPKHSGPGAYKSISNPIKKRVEDAIKQEASIAVIVLEERYTLPEVIEGVRRAFAYRTEKGVKQISEIYLRYRDEGVSKIDREQYESGDYIKTIEDTFIEAKK